MNSWDFTQSKLKVSRAKRHIDEFQSCLADWIKSDPFLISIEKDSNTGNNVAKLTVTETLPEDFPLIIGDAVHNLRSALDFIAIEIVRKAGLKFSRIYFPFADDIQGIINSQSLCEISQASPEASIIIRDEIKPYKTGNNFIWCLNRLSNIDKHRFLIANLPRVEFYKVPIEGDDKVGVAPVTFIFDTNDPVDIILIGTEGLDLKIKDYRPATHQIFFDETQITGLPKIHIPDLLGECAKLIGIFIAMFERI